MSAPRARLFGAVAAAVLALTTGGPATGVLATATAAAPTYTVTVGAKGTWTNPDDTPASGYLDKDGTFYYQQSHSLYGASDSRQWSFFTGSTFDTATRSSAISNAGTNADTTAFCDNSPTGLGATAAPAGSGYSQRNFCDLSGVWVDPDTGDWYGLVHNEFTPQPFGDSSHYDAIDYAVSTDQGKDWTIKGHAITSPFSTKRGDTAAFPQSTYSYGDGDQRLFVDTASGYFYAYYGSRVIDKNGGWKTFYEHVARAPLSSKMATGSWQKWYGGTWSQPGVGGKESNVVPVDAANSAGWTPTSKEYDPANAGTADQQVAAGTMPPTSPLFVMDVTYDAYLGLYIGEPQAVDQSGNAPQQFYATDDLATQKWTLIGDTGGYHTASWYRWFLDSANRTSSTIVGKSFRSYCSFGCSGTSSSEYLNVTVGSSAPAPAPFDPAKTYRIAAGNGRVLAQVSGGAATTSLAAATGTGLDAWAFASNGDGSYRISNASTGQLLGVDATSTARRAWGTAPTVTAVGTGGPTVGQQWFVIPGTASGDGSPTGAYRLVNRYSGLVIGLSATSGRLAETTPTRAWTDTSGTSVGGGRTAAEQTLTLTPVGTATQNLDGAHTLTASGKALDDPGHSTATGTRLITYGPNGGPNQSWTFTQQADGSYQLANGESGLCADVDGGSTSAGAAIIQWTCTGGTNQHWKATLRSDGTYTLASVKSGLLLTTASAADGALVTQQPDTGSALQHWTLG
ncbi:RICIN domain-containing protein [Actinacidiphila rubida]|uniref:Ricin-type beta-trefoil lectin domain-like n=1 Tax=Actinacidiphila rubida TaxID=310780 RepID=A0A1H8SPV5_9ACTN|nr:RICIN domain-containing protein [Actinacidiphila rubida]SEO80566.1 Ricin-type beta-trefoil lectin domain-like [Actinacidiphila rubida]